MDEFSKVPMTEVLEEQEELPHEQRFASVCVLAGPQAGRICPLDAKPFVIGRSVEDGLELTDDGVSRRHAQMTRRPNGTVVLLDLNSTNGTFCNGERVHETVLEHGDRVRIGASTILKFSLHDAVEAEFQRSQFEAARRDGMTDCYNRRFLLEHLAAEYSFCQRHQRILSLAMFDLDHFKHVNDTFGHAAGDEVLRFFVQLVLSNIRTDDVLARYGGEEFVVVMREIPATMGTIVAERVVRSLASTPISFHDDKIAVTVSAGVVSGPGQDTANPRELLQAADLLLYQAKRNGRNRVVSVK